jgi:eukaryotic-like serine/threonine-protein kinase
VHAVLARVDTADSFLEAPALGLAARALTAANNTRVIPAAIGRYRVTRLLGEGGMGAVYEAEQDQPRRTVALKVIKPGFATPETLRRFQHESQALGRLQHPGIAQIYEAGTADTAFGPQLYFAMELIRGLPLHEYAEKHRLNARQRLELMAEVCDAVEHAHQRGVIHRDLKPGNILVDETGQPKIVDFGVARVTDSDAQLTRQTGLGQLVGTLAYMSPEQVLGDPLALDTRSDVYTLGVILYQVLSGNLPYSVEQRPLHEAVAVIREEDAAPLGSIHRSYRGDIATIVAKALDKHKGRRYGSASEVAADIRRYLADEPIMARPASATYQLQKFARRHRALVVGTAAVFLVLIAGVAASSWEALRVRHERNVALAEKGRADAEAATAQAINHFLQHDLLAQASASNQASPSVRPDQHLEVRTALDRAAARIGGKFERQPEVEAAIRDTIGQTYIDLGLRQEGRQQLERALQLERRALGLENPKTLQIMEHLGNVVNYTEAEALRSEILAIRRRVLGPNHKETLTSMRGLAEIYVREKKEEPAESLYKEVIEAQRRVLGPDNPETLKSMQGLAYFYPRSGRGAEPKYFSAQRPMSRRASWELSIPTLSGAWQT